MPNNSEIEGLLSRAADEMRAEGQNGWPIICDDAASAISCLSTEVQELRAALRPFAEAGGQVPNGHGPDNEPVSDDEPVTMSVVGFLVGDVTAADLARARAALKPEPVK